MLGMQGCRLIVIDFQLMLKFLSMDPSALSIPADTSGVRPCFQTPNVFIKIRSFKQICAIDESRKTSDTIIAAT
tara:strand:+ start:613 stop:834 length:222 start_codon:yes stop_codon:yes gene_type:complete